MKARLGRRGIVLLLIAGGLLAIGGGLAYANIPDGGNVIHGCYQKNSGALRVIDTEKGQSCAASEAVTERRPERQANTTRRPCGSGIAAGSNFESGTTTASG